MTKLLNDLIEESSFEIHESIDLEIKLEGKESKKKKSIFDELDNLTNQKTELRSDQVNFPKSIIIYYLFQTLIKFGIFFRFGRFSSL